MKLMRKGETGARGAPSEEEPQLPNLVRRAVHECLQVGDTAQLTVQCTLALSCLTCIAMPLILST